MAPLLYNIMTFFYSFRLFRGNNHYDFAALGVGLVYIHLASKARHDGAAEGKSHARSGDELIHLGELLEHPFLLVYRNSASSVAHFNGE